LLRQLVHRSLGEGEKAAYESSLPFRQPIPA